MKKVLFFCLLTTLFSSSAHPMKFPKSYFKTRILRPIHHDQAPVKFPNKICSSDKYDFYSSKEQKQEEAEMVERMKEILEELFEDDSQITVDKAEEEAASQLIDEMYDESTIIFKYEDPDGDDDYNEENTIEGNKLSPNFEELELD